MVKAHDSVAVVLYHTEMRSMLMVRQFRPAVYASLLRAAGIHSTLGQTQAPPLEHAFTCELCAGIVDKDMSLRAIAQEEIAEECGYNVPEDSIERLTSFIASVGSQGSTQTLFLARVDESMRAESGGGLAHAGEAIELLALPLDNVEAFVMDDSVGKTSGAMFGLTWAKQRVLHDE